MKDFKIGFTACYIRDYKFTHLITLPEVRAVEWVKKISPEVNMGLNTLAKDLTCETSLETDATGNGWLNKLFILVGNDHGQWIALNNHDGRFSIYIENIN